MEFELYYWPEPGLSLLATDRYGEPRRLHLNDPIFDRITYVDPEGNEWTPVTRLDLHEKTKGFLSEDDGTQVVLQIWCVPAA